MEKVTLTSIKLSIVYLYRRIFAVRKAFLKLTDCAIALISIWGTVFLLAELILYLRAFTGALVSSRVRWSSLWFATSDVLGDAVIFSLPYLCLLEVQMGGREKARHIATFALQNM